MSVFREVQDLHLLEKAEPLATNGATCLAYKVKIYDRWQFIKRLRPELEHNTRYIALFTKEYMVGSRLNHPNLVRYNEMETSEEGAMMILDYIEGKTLSEILHKEPEFFRGKGRLERFCTQLLDCLQYLHSNQVLHLDLKPDNIMITRVDEDVKVLDLGFCRTDCFTDSEGKTAKYSAPEQSAKSTALVDTRTDLYAFGRILEEIEKATGPLPQRYKRLMHGCLQADPELRPRHASDCLKQIQFRSIKNWLWGIGLSIFALIAALCMLNEHFRNEAQFAFRHFNIRGYLWEYQGVHINILSDEDMTAEVVGWELRTYDKRSSVIPATQSYAGREYTITAVHESAFDGDKDLESISFPEGMKSIGKEAFRNCSDIPFVHLPNSVTELGADCFAYCTGVRHVKLSDSLTFLPERCFHANIDLKEIDIPEGITKICTDCFVADSALVEVHLPSTLTTLERGVFYLCTKLSSITLPAKLSYVGELCFYECPSLKDIYCLAPEPPSVMMAFDRKDINLHVPAESLAAYQNNSVWGNLHIVAIEDNN